MSDADRIDELESRTATLHVAVMAVLMQFIARAEKPQEALDHMRTFLLSRVPGEASRSLCADLERLVKLNERRKN